MVDRAGLENQYDGNVIRGSNPLASATFPAKRDFVALVAQSDRVSGSEPEG